MLSCSTDASSGDGTHLRCKRSDVCCPQVLVGLANASSGATSAGALRQSVPEKTVVGIFRDLRGIAMATNSRRTYGVCCSWLAC